VFKNCGHVPQTERTDEWVRRIVAFAREAA
jgi:pimeloyl-ACP methyl ester carboxylesterase